MRKVFLVIFAAATLSAQKPPNKQDEIIIKLDKILKILEEADAPPPPLKVDVQAAPGLGEKDATITVVEFTDLQCPFCSRFHTETFPKLHDQFIATGKIRFVSLDLPLPMHKNAMPAAEAGRCAGEQGHFWEMRDWMQSNPDKLDLDPLIEHARALDLNDQQFQDCLKASKYHADIQADMTQAQKLGITGTPAFVIGKSGPMIEGQLITGAQPLAAFEKAILAVK